MKKLSIITLFIVVQFSFSQEDLIFKGKKHKLGFIVGYGAQHLNQLLSNINEKDANSIKEFLIKNKIKPDEAGLDVTYSYEVTYFQAQYYYSLLRKSSWGIDLLSQPQYNLTKYKHLDKAVATIDGYEVGLNVGILIRKNFINDLLSFYALISSGPHYVKGTPARQSDGFIFSDNFVAGLTIKILKDAYIDIRPGFRHISNAGLKYPNGGVNDFFISGGLMFAL
ncbi:hypothetical protein HN014_19315 [Aquimarina sp. TRL1]|uniref:acyloxyacyl hydrolase n=1 Tax=Aquimarina sp. (strain TRL1) TaxID=2736252 RepID=UPI00158B1B95|nr:acyloxyacyl hydrolase [Aquimarina sp. TRL1]QKX06975.1 hypothetical protein HN014_19315 [Aquimarina sp. TRL1]